MQTSRHRHLRYANEQSTHHFWLWYYRKISKLVLLFYLYLDRRFDQIEFSRPHFDFFQGDSILVECTYDSTRKNKPTVVSKNKSFGIVCFVHLELSVLFIWNRLFCTFGIVCFVHFNSSILYIWNRLFCTFGIVCFVHLESSVLYIWNRLFCTFGIVCHVHLESSVLYIWNRL